MSTTAELGLQIFFCAAVDGRFPISASHSALYPLISIFTAVRHNIGPGFELNGWILKKASAPMTPLLQEHQCLQPGGPGLRWFSDGGVVVPNPRPS